MFGRSNNITEVEKLSNGNYLVHFVCPFCLKKHTEEISAKDFSQLSRLETENVQHVFPDKSAEFREKFITGMCHECQKEVFN